MIDLAVLDIAGTTVEEGGAVYRVLASVVTADTGKPVSDADLRAWMGADKHEALSALTGRDDVEDLHTAFVARLREAYTATPPVPLPGVPEALAALRSAGVKVALTTGFDRQVTDPLLASLGWRLGDHLDAVVCASEVAGGRPRPDMIHRAMELTGAPDPRRVLAAGDTALDVRAGLAARAAFVVAVLTGAQTRAELAAEHPTHILDGVAGIPALLELPTHRIAAP